MAEKDSTTKIQEIRTVIERAKDSFTSIAGVAHLAGQAFDCEGEDDGYDPHLSPWNKGHLTQGTFNQIFKEAGVGWNLLFEDFDSLFRSLENPPEPQEEPAAAQGGE